MYIVMDATASPATGMSDDRAARPSVGPIFKAALASLRTRWRHYQDQLALQQMDEHVLRDIGLQRTHGGRIIVLGR